MENYQAVLGIGTLINAIMIAFFVKRYVVKVKHSETERETNFKEINFIISTLKDERDRLLKELRLEREECKETKRKLRAKIEELEKRE